MISRCTWSNRPRYNRTERTRNHADAINAACEAEEQFGLDELERYTAERNGQMTDDTYNGYSNWETWNVKLYIDNEQGSYEHWHDIGRDLLHRNTEDRARRELIELLEQARDEGTLASDAISWHRVDFHEIADEILEHAQELIDHDS
jgi:hypothetical protein